MNNRRLWFYWPILVIGIVLIVAPFAISLPSKASAGQKMLDQFHPIMQPASVTQTADYYYKTFVQLRPVAVGGPQAAAEAPKLVGALAQQLKMSPAQVQKFLGGQFPAVAGLITSLPALVPVFQNVPPGTRSLQAARRRDAGQRVELPEDRQLAELPPVHVVLLDPGHPARSAGRLATGRVSGPARGLGLGVDCIAWRGANTRR